MKLRLQLLAMLLFRLTLVWAGPVPDTDIQQAMAFLATFQQAINELNNRPDAVVTPENQREELLATFFYSDTASVPNSLMPMSLYQSVGGQLVVRGWLNQLPAYFWEGFGYELDTARVVIKSVKTIKNRVQMRLLVPVQMHGLVQTTRRRHEFNEDQEFLVSAERQGGATRNWKIERITGTGQGFRRPQLTMQNLLDYQEKLTRLVMQVVFSGTSASQRACALQQLDHWMPMPSDSLPFTIKTASGQIRQVSMQELTQLNLSAELAAACQIERFDLMHTGNFYNDKDGRTKGNVIILNGVSVWLDGRPVYQKKTTEVVQVLSPGSETVRISNVVIHF